MKLLFLRHIFLALCLSFLALPVLAANDTRDPYESMNRELFAVHLVLDKNIAQPVARGYRAITPEPVRKSIGNFFRNLSQPVTMINAALQGNWERLGQSSGRFIINSTFGILGLFDIASAFDIDNPSEDMGQTLARAGLPSGPYIFIPLYGPTTPRHLLGFSVDIFANPYNHLDQWEDRTALATLDIINVREQLLDPLDDLENTSVDLYASMRSFYLQNRESEINDGEINLDQLPDVLELGD